MLVFVHGLCFPEKVSVFKNYILYCPAEPEIYRVMNGEAILITQGVRDSWFQGTYEPRLKVEDIYTNPDIFEEELEAMVKEMYKAAGKKPPPERGVRIW